MHGNVKFTVQWGSPCWELWICALFNKIVNKIFSEDFAQQLSIIVQFLHISTIPHKIEEMGMTIILKLLFLNSLLASNVHIFVCVFLFFHLSLFMPLLSVLVLCFLFCLCVFRLCPLFAKDCFLTGQEQACTRITRLVVRLSPCQKWSNTQNGCWLPHKNHIHRWYPFQARPDQEEGIFG